MHSLEEGPEHVEQVGSQGWQFSEKLSKYVPAAHEQPPPIHEHWPEFKVNPEGQSVHWLAEGPEQVLQVGSQVLHVEVVVSRELVPVHPQTPGEVPPIIARLFSQVKH